MELITPNLLPEKEKSEFIKQVQHEYKLLGKIPVKKGLTLFSFNTETTEIKPVEIKSEVTLTIEQGKPVEKIKRTAIHEKDCVYVYALNRKNVEKKILKVINNIRRNHD